jgi:hypothetical protein
VRTGEKTREDKRKGEKTGEDEGERFFERLWNHDVVLHQQMVNYVADYWKELGKARSISGEVVEKVVQQIAVIWTTFIPHFPPSVPT